MPEPTFRIGDFGCYALADGSFPYPKSALFPGQSETRVAEVIGPQDAASEEMKVGYTGILVDTGKQRVLIDTGAGPLGPETGRLPKSLRDAGFDPTRIEVVVLSHLHADHIGGLLEDGGTVTFPNAEFIVSWPEYDFWKDNRTQQKLAAGKLYGLGELEQVILTWLQKYVPSIEKSGRLRVIEGDQEVAPGVVTTPAFGHTPGHLAVLVSSGRQQLLYAGDALVHPAQVKQPLWNTVFEVLPDEAIATRGKILDRAAADRCLAFLYHFPFPSFGSISRAGGGYRWDQLIPDAHAVGA